MREDPSCLNLHTQIRMFSKTIPLFSFALARLVLDHLRAPKPLSFFSNHNFCKFCTRLSKTSLFWAVSNKSSIQSDTTSIVFCRILVSTLFNWLYNIPEYRSNSRVHTSSLAFGQFFFFGSTYAALQRGFTCVLFTFGLLRVCFSFQRDFLLTCQPHNLRSM